MEILQHAIGNNRDDMAIQGSPYSMSSVGITNTKHIDSDHTDIIAQLALDTGGDGGGRDGGGNGGIGNGAIDEDQDRKYTTINAKRNEFTLVNSRNITITPFTGRNLNTNPHLPLNNAVRSLILVQGADGEVLLRILDKIEARGATKFTSAELQAMITKYPKVAEFDVAIKAALLNWTTGIANNMIEYGVNNGLDAWRKLYHRYVPLADDLRNILIQELMSLKHVSETEIDTLFNEIERIIDLYSKTGPADDLSDKWIRAAIMRNIPEKRATTISMELKRATTTDEMQSVINVYMHDSRTGIPRGTPGPMIPMIEKDPADKPAEPPTIKISPHSKRPKQQAKQKMPSMQQQKVTRRAIIQTEKAMASVGNVGDGVTRDESMRYS